MNENNKIESINPDWDCDWNGRSKNEEDPILHDSHSTPRPIPYNASLLLYSTLPHSDRLL